MSDANTAAKNLSTVFENAGKDAIDDAWLLNEATHKMMSVLISPLVAQMGISDKTSTPIDLFDNACGMGAITQQAQHLLPREILEKSTFFCADNAAAMVELVKKRVQDEGWVNVGCQKLDAMNNDLPADSFTHVGLGLALHLTPDPDAVLANCRHTLKNGGVFGATTWHRDSTFWVRDVRSAFEGFPFEAPLPDPFPMQLHSQGDWTDPAWIEHHLKTSVDGFTDVKVTTTSGTYHVESARHFVTLFAGMINWVTSSFWSEEVLREYPPDKVKEMVRGHLEEKYEGKGWDLYSLIICSTARIEK